MIDEDVVDVVQIVLLCQERVVLKRVDVVVVVVEGGSRGCLLYAVADAVVIVLDLVVGLAWIIDFVQERLGAGTQMVHLTSCFGVVSHLLQELHGTDALAVIP